MDAKFKGVVKFAFSDIGNTAAKIRSTNSRAKNQRQFNAIKRRAEFAVTYAEGQQALDLQEIIDNANAKLIGDIMLIVEANV